jgi:hypothetical protein
MYPDWWDGSVAKLFMSGKKDYWLVGSFLQLDWVHQIMAYFGIFFDLLVVPLLLWKRTRVITFFISVFFHLFNSIIFQIGIFPYMSMAFAFFFFSSEILQRYFLRKKKLYTGTKIETPKYKNLLLIGFGLYFIIQIGLPLRHWAYQDDVLWTEEGHRLSWRMMLRSKGGYMTVYTVDKATKERKRYKYDSLLTKKQKRSVRTRPDMMWQLAQRIKRVEAKKGKEVEVYINSKVKINGSKYFKFTDPEIDIANEEWQHFKHHSWILKSPKNYIEETNQMKLPKKE